MKRISGGVNHAGDLSRAARLDFSKRTNKRALLLGDAAFAIFGVGPNFLFQSLRASERAVEGTERQ